MSYTQPLTPRMYQTAGTNAQWNASSYILGYGEWGITTDAPYIRKIGDGFTSWANLTNVIRPYYHILHLAAPAAPAGGGVQETLFNNFTTPSTGTFWPLTCYDIFSPIDAGCTMGRLWIAVDITVAQAGETINFNMSGYPEVVGSLSAASTGYAQTYAGGVWSAIPWQTLTSAGNTGIGNVQYKATGASGAKFNIYSVISEWI